MRRTLLDRGRIAADALRLGRPARWLWRHRPGTAADRRFAAWLAEAGRRDDERMRLVMACTLSEESNCVDIGAATGDLLADMIRLSPRGRHIAYEPLPELHAILRERFPHIDARNAAVSDSAGEVEFVHVRNAPGWSGLRQYDIAVASPEMETIRGRTVRLDDDLPEGSVPDFVKIDVNGAEVEVVRGGGPHYCHSSSRRALRARSCRVCLRCNPGDALRASRD